MNNESIADNIPNTEIISRLDAMGHPGITPMNLSRWSYSGYLIWLRHRERLDAIRLQSEANCELIRQVEASDPNSCSRANNIYLATQLAQLMHDVSFTGIKKLMEKDPSTFFRLARVVNAQTRNTFRHQKLQTDLAKQQLLEQRDLGQLPPTTSAAGYAAAAEYYGLPPRFRKDLPKPASANSTDDQISTKTDSNIGP